MVPRRAWLKTSPLSHLSRIRFNTDNDIAFNQSRRGNVSGTDSFLSTHGCLGLTGRGRHPQTQTQGKKERSQQILQNFLDDNGPDSP